MNSRPVGAWKRWRISRGRISVQNARMAGYEAPQPSLVRPNVSALAHNEDPLQGRGVRAAQSRKGATYPSADVKDPAPRVFLKAGSQSVALANYLSPCSGPGGPDFPSSGWNTSTGPRRGWRLPVRPPHSAKAGSSTPSRPLFNGCPLKYRIRRPDSSTRVRFFRLPRQTRAPVELPRVTASLFIGIVCSPDFTDPTFIPPPGKSGATVE